VREKGTGVSKNLGFMKIEPSETALELDGIEVGERLTVVKRCTKGVCPIAQPTAAWTCLTISTTPRLKAARQTRREGRIHEGRKG
jgi:hypothetical protein